MLANIQQYQDCTDGMQEYLGIFEKLACKYISIYVITDMQYLTHWVAEMEWYTVFALL